jgi:hypothetical protein
MAEEESFESFNLNQSPGNIIKDLTPIKISLEGND